MWVCGLHAFAYVPSNWNWSGCCYPAMVFPGFAIHQVNPFGNLQSPPHHRVRRDVPIYYNDFTLTDSAGTNIGYSLVIVYGATKALNKISSLGWHILKSANETELAFTFINDPGS